jgi:hypothetical protein
LENEQREYEIGTADHLPIALANLWGNYITFIEKIIEFNE